MNNAEDPEIISQTPEGAAQPPIDLLADAIGRATRWQAEFENLQKRTAKDVLNAATGMEAQVCMSLFHIMDALDTALGLDREISDLKAILRGLDLTATELKKVLSVRGIESFTPTGQPFDPRFHEAVGQLPSETVPTGHVVVTYQRGYQKGEKLIRAAMVAVSVGRASQGASSTTSQDQSSQDPSLP